MDARTWEHMGVGGTTSLGTDAQRTVQGEITVNMSVDFREGERRKKNASNFPKDSYPGGGDDDNLKLAKGELVMAWRRPRYVPRRGLGQPQQVGFTSFNGIMHGHYVSRQGLEDDLVFVGQNKVDYRPTDDGEIQNGISTIAYGSTTIAYDGFKPAYPGDPLVFRVPPLHSKSGEFRPPEQTGKPHQKLRILVEPFNLKDLNYMIDDLFAMIVDVDEESGIGEVNINALEEGNGQNLDKRQRAALSFKKTILMNALRSIESLQARGIVIVNTPERNERRTNRERLLNGIFDVFNKNLEQKNVGIDHRLNYDTIERDDIAGLSEQTAKDMLWQMAQNVNRANNVENNVEKTNVSKQPNPTGSEYWIVDPETGRKVVGPQFHEGHTFFRMGLHWSKFGDGVGTGGRRVTSESELMGLRLERERSILWLAGILGAIGDNPRRNVVDDLIKTVCLKYEALNSQLKYAPDFRAEDGMDVGGLSNRHKIQYVRNALDHFFEYEEAVAQNYYSIVRRMIGTMASVGTYGLDQKADVVLGTRRVN